MAPVKQGPVWPRRAFIKAWQGNAGAKDWETFFKAMDAARVAAGCNAYKADTGLSIQIGKVRKGLNDAGYEAPSEHARPKAEDKPKPTITEDADALGLTKIK